MYTECTYRIVSRLINIQLIGNVTFDLASIPSVSYFASVWHFSVGYVDKIIRRSPAPASRGHLIVFFRKFYRRCLSSWQTTPLSSLPFSLAVRKKRLRSRAEKMTRDSSRWTSVWTTTLYREYRRRIFPRNWFNINQCQDI